MTAIDMKNENPKTSIATVTRVMLSTERSMTAASAHMTLVTTSGAFALYRSLTQPPMGSAKAPTRYMREVSVPAMSTAASWSSASPFSWAR